MIVVRPFAFLSIFCVLLSAAQSQPPQTTPPQTQPSAPGQPPPSLTPEARGDIYMARRMFREALETYLSIRPPSAVLYNKAGICHQQMGDLNSAKKMYDRAIKLNKKYAEAINNLGTVHYARRSYRRAVSAYKKALVINPNSASIHSNLGTAYFARRDYKRALENYEKAVAIDPDVFEHRSTQGVLLQERAVEERAKFHYFLAKTYAKARRNDLALLYIRKSLEEGFKERQKYIEDKEFAELRKLPEFEELMKLEPRVL